VYFAAEMLKTKDQDFKGKTCVVSGSGNVAQYTVEKLNQLGAKVLTMSDSNGFVYDKDGITQDKLEWVMDLKNVKRGRISEYVKQFPTAEYHANERPWHVPAQCAFPSATQNEINEEQAQALVKNGCIMVSEGANMPSTLEAIKVFQGAKILFGPAKAANAGGVATSGLEMSQNSIRLSWTREEVNERLHNIMKNIHANAYNTSIEYGDKGNYLMGANIAAFIKVADSMIAQGVV
jgi:glutamate dehydrogenase (NADP+)